MRIDKKYKRAYTLAEIMVVLLVLTIIFAAFAPIFTKRAAKSRSVDIWTSTDAPNFDAYTDSNGGQNGAMFLGVKPASQMDVFSEAFLPLAKLVVRSGPIGIASQKQAQIQFRQGNGPRRNYIANWLVDPNGNFLLGGEYTNLRPTQLDGEDAVITEGRPYDNTALGYGAFNSINHVAPNITSDGVKYYKNTSNKNVAVGHGAMLAATGGMNNVVVGSGAGQLLDFKFAADKVHKIDFTSTNVDDWFSQSGMNNTFVGYKAGYNVTPAVVTISSFGDTRSNLTGRADNNVAIGYMAWGGDAGTTRGYNNTYIGAFAGLSSHESSVMKDESNHNAVGHNNVAIGYEAMRGIGYLVYSGDFGSAPIHHTGDRTSTGTFSISNVNSVSGHDNVAIGMNALKNLTSGSYNVAIGYNACAEVTKGSYKTCIGANSGPHGGWDELNSTKKLYDDGINGSAAKGIFYNNGEKHGATTDKNTSADYAYFDGRIDQVQRTYIGSKPKEGFGGDAVLEIHNPTAATTGIRNRVGYATNSNTTTVINGNLIVRGRPYFTVGSILYHFNTFTVGTGSKAATYYGIGGTNSSIDFTQAVRDDGKYPAITYSSMVLFPQFPKLFDSNVSVSSDRRLKDIGSRFTAGLEELRNIKVYNYNFKADKDKKPHVGVIAQELQKVFPTAVFKGEDGYLKIRWDELFYAVLNGIKEIDKRVATLSKRIVNFDSKISKLEKQNTELKTKVDDLTARVNRLKAQ